MCSCLQLVSGFNRGGAEIAEREFQEDGKDGFMVVAGYIGAGGLTHCFNRQYVRLVEREGLSDFLNRQGNVS